MASIGQYNRNWLPLIAKGGQLIAMGKREGEGGGGHIGNIGECCPPQRNPAVCINFYVLVKNEMVL